MESPPQIRHGKPLVHPDYRGVQYFYTLVHGSTGLPADDNSNSDQECHGPFIFEATAEIAFDLALGYAGNNQPGQGKFSALANWIATSLESRPVISDFGRKLKITYASFATEAVSEQRIHSVYLPHEPFQYDWSRLEMAMSNDLPNFRNEYLPDFLEFYNYLIFISPQIDLWEEFFQYVLGNVRPSLLDFSTGYAIDVAEELREFLERRIMMVSSDEDDISLINTLAKVLVTQFENARLPDIQMLCRYGGHLIDAIAVSMIKSKDVSRVGEVVLAIAEYCPCIVQDAVRGTLFVQPLQEALNELKDEYNNRTKWPNFIWEPLVDYVQQQIPAQFTGGDNLYPSEEHQEDEEAEDVDEDHEGYEEEEEEFQYYELDDDGMETRAENLNVGDQDYSSCACKGTKVTYRLKWGCQEGHVTELGDIKELTLTCTMDDGDCASRIHEDVKQIFQFVTEFQSVRLEPNLFAPDLVFSNCILNDIHR